MKYAFLVSFLLLASCGRLDQVGRAPTFEPLEGSYQHHALYSNALPKETELNGPTDASSLWTAGESSLFGDRRAGGRGDILTVVIEIDEKAEISNSSGRSRSGKEKLGIPSLLGIPQRLDPLLPDGASLADAVSTTSSSSYQGEESVARNEKLTLRVAEIGRAHV